MNIKSLCFIKHFVFKHISLYTFRPSWYLRKWIWFFLHQVWSSFSYARLPNTCMCTTQTFILLQVYCLPSVHALQTNLEVGQKDLPRVIPRTMFWSLYTILTSKCPSLWNQNSMNSLPVCECIQLAACIQFTSIKVILYSFPFYLAITITSPFAPPTMSSFTSNHTFNRSIKTCSLKTSWHATFGMWSTSIM